MKPGTLLALAILAATAESDPCPHRHTEVRVQADGTVRRWCLRCRKELLN